MSDDGLEERKQISEITPELLQSGEWKDAEFRAFDVTLESATPRTGRSHPMQELIERIRRIFLEMGFSELVDDYVQTAGWNMDALFIPKIIQPERCKTRSILMNQSRWNWMQT